MVGREAETAMDIHVDRSDPETVVEGQEHEGDYGVANDEAEAHLQVCHVGGHGPAWHSDECDS